MKVVLKMSTPTFRTLTPVSFFTRFTHMLSRGSSMKTLRSQIEELEGRLDEEVKLRQEAIEAIRWERARQARADAEEAEVSNAGSSANTNIPNSGLNTTTRSKILKMYRMGQPVEQIAEALKVPRGEVELLVRVHEIAMKAFREVSRRTGSGAEKS